MKKRLVALLALLLLISAAYAEGELRGYSEEEGYIYVTFGRYYQSIDGGIPDDGQQTWKWHQMVLEAEKQQKKTGKAYDPGELEPEPILWRVLSADEEKVFLLSEYVLFASPVHSSAKEYSQIGADFGQTELSAKLNGEFSDIAFTKAEQEIMLPRGTMGKVFLISKAELEDPALGFGKGSKKNASRKAWATEYAVRVTGVYVYQPKNGKKNHTPYWMIDQAVSDKRHCMCIKAEGQIGRINCITLNEGARPAIDLKADGYRIAGGSGTKEDPYRLETADQ